MLTDAERAEFERLIRQEFVGVSRQHFEQLLDLLGNPPRVENVPDSFWQSMNTDLAAATQPELENVFMASARRLADQTTLIPTVNWMLVNQSAADWARSYSFQMVSGIERTSKRKLQQYIPQFFAEQMSIDELGGLIAPLFGKVRGQMIAETEVTRASARGQFQLVKEVRAAGIDMVPFWDTNHDALVCPICGAEGLMGVQGRVLGNTTLYKSRDGATYGPPPAHVRCRCSERWEPRKAKPTGVTAPAPVPVEPVIPKTPPRRAVTNQPAGTPVSSKMTVPKGKYHKMYTSTLDAIDAIHGDGELKAIPLKTKVIQALGAFYRSPFGGGPIQIVINPKGDHKQLTLAHEIGHWLDNFLGKGGFASDGGSVLDRWWRAIQKSTAYQRLIDKRDNPLKYAVQKVVKYGNNQSYTYTLVPDVQFLTYQSSRREFWARSYAQYVATRSGNADMLEQAKKLTEDEIHGDQQWSPADFADIAAAIDEVFRELGWIV